MRQNCREGRAHGTAREGGRGGGQRLAAELVAWHSGLVSQPRSLRLVSSACKAAATLHRSRLPQCSQSGRAGSPPGCSAAFRRAGRARLPPPPAPRSPPPAAARGTCGRSAAPGSCPSRRRCTASRPPPARQRGRARRRRGARRSRRARAAPGRRSPRGQRRSRGGRRSPRGRHRRLRARRGRRLPPSGSAGRCRGRGCRTCSTGGGSGSGLTTGTGPCARTAGRGRQRFGGRVGRCLTQRWLDTKVLAAHCEKRARLLSPSRALRANNGSKRCERAAKAHGSSPRQWFACHTSAPGCSGGCRQAACCALLSKMDHVR